MGGDDDPLMEILSCLPPAALTDLEANIKRTYSLITDLQSNFPPADANTSAGARKKDDEEEA